MVWGIFSPCGLQGIIECKQIVENSARKEENNISNIEATKRLVRRYG